MDRRAFLVGLLLEEYRRIWIDHEAERLGPVSYTRLTLPTIYSV